MDNIVATLKFANGTVGTITYMANGDKSASKERLEVFGGTSVAILEDFRRLELVRNGQKKISRTRWKQDKGHQIGDARIRRCGARQDSAADSV